MCWTEELGNFNNRVTWNNNVGGKNLENSIKVLDGINELVPSINKFKLGVGPIKPKNSKMIFPQEKICLSIVSPLSDNLFGTETDNGSRFY